MSTARALRCVPARLLAVGLLSALALACSGDATGPRTSYENISGSYAGAMVGTSQGVLLTAEFSLTVAQNGGSLSGTYALTGDLSDAVVTLPIQGTGTISGTIAAGNNPSVNLTIRSGSCSNYTADFSGAYDSANRKLTLSGPVDILANDCSIFLRYSATIILSR